MNKLSNRKIIISSYDDLKNPYYAGGGAAAVHEIAKRLARKNWVTVITGKYPGSKDEIIENVTYRRVGLSAGGAKIGQLAYQLYLPFLVARGNYDIWIESFTPPFSTNFLPLFTFKPVIGLVHMLSGEDMKRKYKLPFEVIENLGLGMYKHVIVTSELMKQKILTKCPPNSVTVISNGVKLPANLPQMIKNRFILFMGRIEVDQKGLDLLLFAYSKVKSQVKLPLYIAGSGEKKEEEKLFELIKSLQITRQVRLLGRVNDLRKEWVYKNAAFVVLPSRFETFSLVALETMAYQKGLVSFNIDGLSWVPKNCAIKINGLDTNTLSQTLLELSRNPSLAANLGEEGRKFAENFSWDTAADKYEDYISKAISTKNYAQTD